MGLKSVLLYSVYIDCRVALAICFSHHQSYLDIDRRATMDLSTLEELADALSLDEATDFFPDAHDCLPSEKQRLAANKEPLFNPRMEKLTEHDFRYLFRFVNNLLIVSTELRKSFYNQRLISSTQNVPFKKRLKGSQIGIIREFWKPILQKSANFFLSLAKQPRNTFFSQQLFSTPIFLFLTNLTRIT